jgi:hypothetical protein
MVKGGFEVRDVQGWKARVWTEIMTRVGEQVTGIASTKTWY